MRTLSLVLLLAFVAFTSCKKEVVEPQITETEKTVQILTSGSGTWTPATTAGVTVDGVDVTSDLFKGFTISFTADKIVTTGTTPVWLRQDTWRFKDETARIIIRGQDNKEVAIEEISEGVLQLSLKWDQTTYAEGGKSKSIPGTFVFTLSK